MYTVYKCINTLARKLVVNSKLDSKWTLSWYLGDFSIRAPPKPLKKEIFPMSGGGGGKGEKFVFDKFIQAIAKTSVIKYF